MTTTTTTTVIYNDVWSAALEISLVLCAVPRVTRADGAPPPHTERYLSMTRQRCVHAHTHTHVQYATSYCYFEFVLIIRPRPLNDYLS